MPQVTQGRKRYLLPPPDRSKPPQPPAQDLSALKLDKGCKGCGVLRTRREDGKQEDLYITSTTSFWIGRRPDCDYVVSFPVVSRRHLKIFAIRNELEEALVCVEDVSTSNGILYNGSKPRSKSIFLSDGDTIEIPKTGKKFTYVRDPDSTSNKKKISMTEMTTLPWNELEKRFGRKKASLSVGQYTIYLDKKLGSGTFGEVRLAWDEMREMQVACKTVRKEKMRDSRDRERLLNELELGLALQHPNLNSVLCWKEVDGDFHVFLKLVTGGDLFSYVSKHQGLEQSETKYLLYQLLKGVKYMHESGCAHRDLKLENILLQTGGSYPTVLICDFGLSTPLPASPEGPYPSPPSGLTNDFAISSVSSKKITAIRAGSVVGTVTYFPPEYLIALREETLARQAGRAQKGKKRRGGLLDATKSDSWALGIIGYIMAT
ncbi:kinase-like domain-containing protein [Mrakia frigida]|uniref:FHA domain-containing serine/threonine-protein kinase n=1 Tax=Mrakia frigida TaxID=29902 RepID=UPI003FCC02F1